MKRILFVATVEEEVSAARQSLHEIAAVCNLEDKISVDFLVTGTRTASIVYSLTRNIMSSPERPDLIINIGIAGSYSDAYPEESVVRLRSDLFGEQGQIRRKGFQVLFNYETLESNTLPFVNGALPVNPLDEPLERMIGRRYPAVKGISVQALSDDRKRAEELKSSFSPDIETMDAASVLYVALSENIPYLGIRAVSNRTGMGNDTQWKTQEALAVLKRECCFLLDSILHL